MTSQCVGSNYANGFYGSSPGLPGGSLQGFPQRTSRGCWDGVGATLFSGVAGVFPGSRLAGGAPPLLLSLWRGLGVSCTAGEWSRRVAGPDGTCGCTGRAPSLVAWDSVHSLLACGWEWPGEMCPASSFPLTFPSSCQLGPEGPGEDLGQQCSSWPHPHHPGWPTVNWDMSKK